MLKRLLPVVALNLPADCQADQLASLFQSSSVAGRRAAVIVDDAAVRIWQTTPPSNLARLADLRIASTLRFETLYGESADDWHIAAAWQADRHFMASAIRRALLADIMDGAAAAGVAVRSIESRFVAAWNRHCRRLDSATWLAQVHGGMLILGAGSGQHLNAVRPTRLPDECGHAWLASHVTREAARLGRALPARLAVCGSVPAIWSAAGNAFPVCLPLAGSTQ